MRNGTTKKLRLKTDGLHDSHRINEKDVVGETKSEKVYGFVKVTRSKGKGGKTRSSLGLTLPPNLKWIPNNWTSSKLKPVIRSALTAWISVLLLIIPRTERMMGQASFLVVIAGFLSPPNDPFIAVLERELILVLFVTLAWAWNCLGAKLASLARSSVNHSIPLASVFTGQYIEAAPTVINAVFLFLGSMFFLFTRARQGPGPFLFAAVLGCVCLDISFTTGNLFPYPYYPIGRAVVIPVALHSAIALVLSVLVFPSTISSQYTDRLIAVLQPLETAMAEHRKLLATSTTSATFSPSAINAAVAKSEAALVPLAATARLMKRDIIWSRIGPSDLTSLQNWARRMAVRANGLGAYFTLIDPLRERFPVTPAPSRPATPALSPVQSRAASRTPSRAPSPDPGAREDGNDSDVTTPGTPATEATHLDHDTDTGHTAARRRLATRSRHSDSGHNRQPGSYSLHVRPHSPAGHPHVHHHLNHLHHRLHLHLSRTPTREQAVGVFESLRYMDIESTHLFHPLSAQFTARATELLGDGCDALLDKCGSALTGACTWLSQTRRNRLKFWRSTRTKAKELKEKAEELERLKRELSEALEVFMTDKRHLVLEPYRSRVDHDSKRLSDDAPPHRFLFHCFVYEYHLMRFAQLVLELYDEMIGIEKKRKKLRVWWPTIPLRNFLTWTSWEPAENIERDDDENPDVIQGMQPEWIDDLGEPRRRDPDVLPPRNWHEMVATQLYQIGSALGRGNSLYAFKAGILTILLSIPSFLASSAHFAYANRFIWGVFMGQLTLVRFRGDTTFGLVARIMSTFLGGVIGIVMWYISTGSGHGNYYGFAAVCGVCFPFFFFVRLYWPGPPMTVIIFFVTIVLVLGYSWQDTHYPQPSSPGEGYDVAWRRFVLVASGVTAAFIFSFLPPSTTLRGYMRRILATTAGETGALYCSIISFANTPKELRTDKERQEIIRSLIAIRAKLKRSIVLRTNIIYEFSLRGRWPSKRYQSIVEIQMQIAYLLSHLMSAVEQLEPIWCQAFLRRTRFVDADFLGDVLAVISLISTALRTGTPLPQITPCPLIDRFMAHQHGLNVLIEEEDYVLGLPKTLTIDTLENEQYLIFCVAVSTAYGIMTRLDRLMVATKEIVGEQYHIHGVGLKGMGTRTNSVRPGMDV
ncbi:hypothetical protein NEOLEDRAFT_1207860 [Neolentinus lepideus HHB14362 ss-1]|uniref:ER transporter 6TM N-terminal domain-containing protein n=1 Tax=Neolentinus lepideus HHB14362 ss-1 TaxID=1314782 RepID=A0A165RXY3_9AGAM|nr:hypothetical protein NEOLEDRAFT_1207860 [Neolentinus lepideus HHB14362 ss-1]